MSPRAAEALAIGKLRLASDRLLSTHELYGKLLARGTFIASAETATMGVTIRRGALQFLYDPIFVARCRVAELAAVLEHELLHLLFDHLRLDRTRYPDAVALLIATESTVNENVTGTLPGQPITIETYGLPPDETTDERYARLVARRTVNPPRHAPTAADSGSQPANDVPIGTDAVPDEADSVPTSGNSFPTAVDPIDDHAVWATPSLEERWTAGRIVRSVVEEIDPGTMSTLPRALRRLLGIPDTSRPGTTRLPSPRGSGGALQGILRRLARRAHSWRTRDRRRHATIAPGTVRGRLRVLFVVDTSGSMDEQSLSGANAALQAASREHDVWVVQCDHTIRKLQRYAGPLTEVVGRGGTDLRPPFAPSLLTTIRPNVIVYLTDGRGPAPVSPPPIPVIWVLPADGSPPAPWGESIRIRTGLPSSR